MKRIALLILTCLLLAGLFAVPAAAAADGTALVNIFTAMPDQETSAENVLVVDRDSGLPLYEKNARSRLYPASTTKMMTALCAAEMVRDLDDAVVTVRQEVLDLLPDDDNSLAGLTAGEELTMRELLYCLMLPSGNDAALVIANYVSDSTEAFAELMNRRAEKLGCTDTHFVNPHGLAGEEQYSTAWDLARIAEAYMQVPALAEIAGTREYTFSTGGGEAVTVHNSNLLLYPDNALYEPSVLGVKTGSMSLGASFVSAAEKDGLRILCVAAGVPARNADGILISPNPALAEGRKFLTWANSSFTKVTLYDGQAELSVVVNGKPRAVSTAVDGPITAVIPVEQAGQLSQRITPAEGLGTAVPSGTVVGTLNWYCGDVPVTDGIQLVLPGGLSAVPMWLWITMWTLLVLLAVCSVFLRREGRRRKQQPAQSGARRQSAPARQREGQRPVPGRPARTPDRNDGPAWDNGQTWDDGQTWDNGPDWVMDPPEPDTSWDDVP